MIEYLPTIENAHPNAKKFMNEEFFWSPIEEPHLSVMMTGQILIQDLQNGDSQTNQPTP